MGSLPLYGGTFARSYSESKNGGGDGKPMGSPDRVANPPFAFLSWENCQEQILAVWILVAKLPNSDLNSAVDFGVDFFPPVFCSEKGPPKLTNNSLAKFTRQCSEKSPWISAARPV